jgi:hypothetical protein
VEKQEIEILKQLKIWVTATDKNRNREHEVFEPSLTGKNAEYKNL